MTDLNIAFIIGFLTLAIVNVALQVKISLNIGAHLQSSDFSTIITARHLANRGLLLGCIACLIWATIGWGAFSLLFLPLELRFFTVVGIFILLGMNLLVPLHFEERISLAG